MGPFVATIKFALIPRQMPTTAEVAVMYAAREKPARKVFAYLPLVLKHVTTTALWWQ
jgi:hypothetical protein